MERLTKRDDVGNAEIIGVIREDLMDGLTYSEFKKAETALNKLLEYEDLEEQNRLIRLPVAVGETVYVVNKNSYGVFVDEGEVLEVSNQRIWAGDACFDYNDIGKTVFLTEKDAEVALKTEEERKV